MPVEVRTRTAPAARGVSGSIDTLFVLALIDTAGLPTDRAVVVRSMADYEAAGGVRADNPTVYDGLDNFFREGGRKAYVARHTTAGTITAGLGLFTEEMGGGQIVAWNLTPSAANFNALKTAAREQGRFALLDVALGDDTVAELTTAAGFMSTTDHEYGALFGPWVEIPAPAGVIGGSARQVPASSTVAALIARSDALGNPNRAPAGRDFPLQYATSIIGPLMSDANAAALRNAGLNPLRTKFGLMVLDGFQTSIDLTPDTPFWQANVSRARMWMKWNALGIGLNYEYKPIDGRGRLAKALEGDLAGMCSDLYSVGGLYGNTAQEAYAINVDVAINTEDTIAQGELRAVVEAKFSLHARTVIIELVSVPVTGNVSAAA